MLAITVISPREALAAWEGPVTSGLEAAIELACPSQPRLRAALTRVVSAHTGGAARSPRRLFAAAILAAITGHPERALPVCVASNLWWAGAEALDDLADARRGGATPAPAELSYAGLLTASIACMSAVPQAYLASSRVPEKL